MTTRTGTDFGFFPKRLDLQCGNITITTLPDLARTTSQILQSQQVSDGWFYCPLQPRRDWIEVRVMPYSARIFSLPMTHHLSHSRSKDPERLRFLVHCLGFFLGMRLSGDPGAYLDSTPLKPGMLNDIMWLGDSLKTAMIAADRFWSQHSSKVGTVMWGVIHSYFIAQNPLLIPYERFIYLYTALEGACYVNAGGRPRGPHGDRVRSLCRSFGIPLPSWIRRRTVLRAIDIRNSTMHEGLFLEAPLGFRSFQDYRGRKRNLTALAREAGSILLGMEALVCRLIVALLGMRPRAYLRSSVHSRQRNGVQL